MARYTESVCRLCRREGAKLFLKGSRCYSKKCSFERRPTPPGQHGVRRRKVGEYGLQLREKQKVRRIYGVLERQFRNYFVDAENRARRDRREPAPLARAAPRQRRLPDRLRARRAPRPASFVPTATSPSTAGRPNISSYQLKPGDRIEVRESHRTREPFKIAKETLRSHQAPEWLTRRCRQPRRGPSSPRPRRDQMPLDLNEQLVVEYYSR